MSIFNLIAWAQNQELRAKREELHKELAEWQAEFETEMYVNIAKEHLKAGSQEASDELIGKMANELAKAIKNRTFEWKRPLPEVLDLGDKEQVDETMKNFDLHMHDVLEQLGYGPYDSECRHEEQ